MAGVVVRWRAVVTRRGSVTMTRGKAALVDDVDDKGGTAKEQDVLERRTRLAVGLRGSVHRAAIASSLFQSVLQSTGSSQDVVVVGIVVSLARYLDGSKLLGRFHVSLAFPLDVLAIASPIVTLDNCRGVVTPGATTETL